MSDVEHALSTLRETIPALPVQRDALVDGPPTSEYTPGYWQTYTNIFGIDFGSDRAMTPDRALQNSIVLSANDARAQDLAKVPLRMMRKVDNGAVEVKAREHWLAELLAYRPNEHMTWFEWKEMVFLHFSLVRNSFIYKGGVSRSRGTVEELIPIMPGRVSLMVNDRRDDFVFLVGVSTMAEEVMLGSIPEAVVSERMIHLRGRLMDGVRGYSTLAAGATTLALAREIADFQKRLFSTDGTLRGVFEKRDGADMAPLSDPAAKRLRAQLAEAMGLLRSVGKPLLLEEGITYKEIQQTAAEAEAAAARDAMIEEVARMYRMPPHKIGHMKAVKYENLETIEDSYVNDSLEPDAQAFEEKCTLSLLTREEIVDKGYFLWVDREALKLTNPAKQEAVYGGGLKNGAITIDEWRGKRGWNPLPNGEGNVRLIPSTYTVIGPGNEVIIAAGKPGDQTGSPDDGQTDGNAGTGQGSDKSTNVVPLRA